ncbi:gastrula zinc finger protein XlCGF57.1, partial [Papilio machaon]|uniref:gastrula zinc finger protein XlCGF57.1 n=1 Tax=Papilio machaon TaxID=76193 RepID=UPI001E664423
MKMGNPDSLLPTLKYLHACRICLGKGQHTLNLFSKNEEAIRIIDKILECFQIKLEFKKHLPSFICKKCIEDVTIAWKFREKCINFEKQFALYNKDVLETNATFLHSNDELEEIEVKEEFGPNEENVDLTNGTRVTGTSLMRTTENRLKCPYCNKTLKNEASLQKHKVSMHQKRKYLGNVTGFGSNRRYHCTKCSYATPHSQTLINHMRTHNGERPYNCDCGKSFTQSSSLAAHKKTHSSITFFTCSVCGKQFKHAFSLKKHLHVHEIAQFSCDICNKLLKSKQSLQAHMQRHYNIHNYSCEDCGSTFVTSSELINHKKKHNVKKNVECHLCGYKTHAKKNLVIHLKRHAGEKSYKCDLCTLSFYTNGDLQRHKRVHTRDKPFMCPTCSQRFTHSTSLNKHMCSVHGIDYKWSDVKWKESRKMHLVTKKNNEANVKLN